MSEDMWINMCIPLQSNTTQCVNAQPEGAMVCQVYGTGPNDAANCGSLNTVNVTQLGGGSQGDYQVTVDLGTNNRETVFTMFCDPMAQRGQPEYWGQNREPGMTVYQFHWRTAYACPPKKLHQVIDE